MNHLKQPSGNGDAFLYLEKPLIFFDLETTGLDCQKDRMVELSAKKINPDGSQSSLHYLINPGIDISYEATALHGITNEMVADKASFCEIAEAVYAFFRDCDLAGYNIRRFDIPFLMEEFHRCKMYPILLTETKVIDVYSVYAKKEPRDLASAVKYYCKEAFDNAHSAQADVEATMKVLKHQLSHYTDLEPNVNYLYKYSCDSEYTIDFSGSFSRNKQGKIIYNFGKYKGKAVDLDNPDHQDYFKWIMEKSNPTVERQMAVKRIKFLHKCHKTCTEWLQANRITSSIEELRSLYKAIVEKKQVSSFSVSQDGKKLTITYSTNTSQNLILNTEDEKHICLSILNDSFATFGSAHNIQYSFPRQSQPV